MSHGTSIPSTAGGRSVAERFAYATIEALTEHIAVLDARGNLVAVNRAWRDFARANSPFPNALCEGANYLDVCDRAGGEEADIAAHFAAGLRAVIGGELGEFSLEYPCHFGNRQRWFIARVTRFSIDEEVRAVVAHTNITVRKLAEQRLASSEKQLRAIFAASRDGILVEQDERIVYVNGSYAALFGYAGPEELIGAHVSAVVSPEDVRRLLEFGRRRLKGEDAPPAFEFRGRRKDGTPVDLEASVSTYAVSGRTYITTTVRDIAERKLAEEALRESEARYRLLLEQASDGIHTYDLGGNILEANAKLCEMLGYTRAEVLRLNIKDLVPPQDLAENPIRFDELRAGQSLLSERRLRRKDGTLFPVEISGRMLPNGVLTAFIRDISERKRAEEALRQAHEDLERRVEERTAQLARANELLKTEIVERLRAEETLLENEEERKELLRRLVAAQEEERRRISRELHDQLGQRMTALMMGLKTLSAESHGRRSALDGLTELQSLADDLTRELHTLAWGLRPPTLDDLGLHTALYNYVEDWAERARVPVDFQSSGIEGRRLPLDVETALYRIAQEALTNVLRHSGAGRVSVVLERLGEEVVAVIEDDGRGFDAEALMRSSDKGGRLGLLGMRERAAMLGGTLSVESGEGAGTSVFVRIPLAGSAGGRHE